MNLIRCDQNIYPCLQNILKVVEYMQVLKGQMYIGCSSLLINVLFVNATRGSVYLNYTAHVSSLRMNFKFDSCLKNRASTISDYLNTRLVLKVVK